MPDARIRAQLNPIPSTSLSSAEVIRIVGHAAQNMRDGAMDVGQKLNVEATDCEMLGSIANLKVVRFCGFPADISAAPEASTKLRFGGLEHFKTSQSTVHLIPMGPKRVLGFGLSKSLLNTVAADRVAAIGIRSAA